MIQVSNGDNNSLFGLLDAPVAMLIEKRSKDHEANDILKEIFYVGKSKHAADLYQTRTEFDPFLPVVEGGAAPFTDSYDAYKKLVVYQSWASKFEITWEAVEDAQGQFDVLKEKPLSFVDAYYAARTMHGARLLGNALQGNTSYTYGSTAFDCTGGDGLCGFSTSHPAKVSGDTYSNVFTNSMSASAISLIETAMQNTKGDNGERLDIRPDTIVIPNIAALKDATLAAIGSELVPGSANNDINVQYGRWHYIVWPELTDYITANTSPFLMLDSKYIQRHRSLVFIDRAPLTVLREQSTNTYVYTRSGRARFNCAFTDWRGIAAGGVSGGTTLS